MISIIATPIGNLGDITFRALETLKKSECIIAEDTRVIKKLLSHFEVDFSKKNFAVLNAQTSTKQVEKILEKIKNHTEVALVSDAGTPGISDPGTYLISKALEQNIFISPIPGPSAVITALCVSGLPTNHFEFFGFLPHKKGRQTFFKNLVEKDHTVIFYESKHRIIKCLQEMTEHLQENRKIVVARELTKIYEEFTRGTPSEVLLSFTENTQKQKGEFVVLVASKTF